MEQINVFMKGIVSDLDNSYITADSWVYPSRNIQIMNRDGKGFVVTGLKGNDIHFEVTEGFIVIAAAENRGILYIVSVNDETGETALGSYPSPSGGHLVNEYNHLQNFNGGNFISNKFGYTGESNVKILVDDSYDESTNIYLCDGVHIDKVINSGFRVDGTRNEIEYFTDNFDNILNHIPSTLKPPIATLSEVAVGGKLKPGMYEIYFRYATLNFDVTEYVSVLYPVQVADGSNLISTKGSENKDVDDNQLYVNKKIVIDITNVDTAFTYLEVGIIRNFSGNDDNIITEAYEIAKRYSIAELNGSLVIDGAETETILTVEDLFMKYAKERVSKDHVFFAGRIFKSNLKRPGYNKELLAFLALIVDVQTYSFPLADYTYSQIEAGETRLYGYQDPYIVSNNISYFEGEIYPFAIQFLLTDGTLTEGFPIRNFDFISGQKKTYGLDFPVKGLVRFPFVGYDKGVKIAFLFEDMVDYINSRPDLYSNVAGVYVMQGEKIDNLVYNGVLMPTVCGVNALHAFDLDPFTEASIDPFYFGSESDQSGAYSFPFPFPPIFQQIYSGSDFKHRSVPVGIYDQEGHFVYYYNGEPIKDSKKLAFISMENMLSNKSRVVSGKRYVLQTFSLYPIGDYNKKEKDYDVINGANVYYTLPHYLHDIEETSLLLTPTIQRIQTITAFSIEKGQHKGEGGFTSFMNDGTSSTSPGFISDQSADKYPAYNRGFVTPKYIGITFDTEEENNHFVDYAKYKMASLYLQENNVAFLDQKINTFSVSYTNYHQVSKLLSIAQMSNPKYNVVYISKGDNFKMRAFTRLIRFFGSDMNTDENRIDNTGGSPWPGYPHFYQFGLMLGFISSSRVNLAMRSFLQAKDEDSEFLYSFYPANKNLFGDILEWIRKSDYISSMTESYAVNHGYDKYYPSVVYPGYEKDIPDDVENYPTKIIFSSKSTPDSYKNNYREITIANAQKFQTKYGEILRLQEGFGILLSLRPKGVFSHQVGQRSLQETSGAEIITGSTDIYLSDTESVVGYYGIQEWTATNISKNYVYGFDSISAMAWRVSFDYNAYGNRVPQQELLSKKFFNDNAFKQIMDRMRAFTNFPFKGTGITIGFDEENACVLFCFMRTGTPATTTRGAEPPAPIEAQEVKEVMIYNEDLNTFIGPSDETSPLYVPYGRKMILVPPKTYMARHKLFLSGVKDVTMFFGETYSNKISFIVNGVSNDPNTNASMFTKIFNALDIKCPQKELISVEYETETQSGLWNFSQNSEQFWNDAEYQENKWLVPFVMSDIAEGEYQTDSNFRGQWLKVTITFSQDINFYIKAIITNFEISFI
jgi:hypothetical protein